MLELPDQRLPLFFGNAIYLLVGINTGPFHYNGNQLAWQQFSQGIAEIRIQLLGKIRQNAFIQCRLIQCGLEINFCPIGCLVPFAHMG